MERDFVRGRWYKKWINCPEDKRDYDFIQRGLLSSRFNAADKWCSNFPSPELSAQEKKEITDFWKQYGIRIDNFNWHRMYYHLTGMHDPSFIPDTIAGLVLYSFYNDSRYELTWRDKNMFSRLLPDVPLPKTFLKRIRNRYYVNGNYYDETDLKSIIEEVFRNINEDKCDIIVKGSRDSGFGRGVKKYHINCESDLGIAINEWINVTDFIIQECVQQHPILSGFNQSSNNMIRICSWRHKNQ